ncbi:MAG: cation:proton antiporter, partial [Planctomycetota bacterium]
LVSLSSTAIVLKVLSDGGNTDTAAGRTSLGILIFQDLAVVAMVMLVPMLAPSGEGEDGGVLGILKALGIGGAIIAVVLVLARKVVPIILEFVARTCRGEIFLLSVIAICVATAWVTSIAGVSAALGVFLGGLVVSESKFRHHAFGEIMPLQILFSATFFVSVGMLLDVGFVMENILLVLAVVGVVAALKLAVTTLAVKLLRRSWPVALGSGLILLQVGEFAFVLGRLGMDNGLSPMGRSEDGFALFIASAVLLMMLTPVLTGLGLRLAQRTTATTSADTETEGVSMSNHVVVAGWGEGGKMIAASLQDAGVPLVVVTLSPPGIEEAKSAGHRVIFGATSRSASLEEAGADRAAAVVIADDDAETTERGVAVARYWVDQGGQSGRVVARVMEPGDVEKVREAGADVVIENQRAGASCVLGAVLASVGFTTEEADKHVETLLRREV